MLCSWWSPIYIWADQSNSSLWFLPLSPCRKCLAYWTMCLLSSPPRVLLHCLWIRDERKYKDRAQAYCLLLSKSTKITLDASNNWPRNYSDLFISSKCVHHKWEWYLGAEEVTNTFSEFVTVSKIKSLTVIVPESGEVHMFLPGIRIPCVF